MPREWILWKKKWNREWQWVAALFITFTDEIKYPKTFIQLSLKIRPSWDGYKLLPSDQRPKTTKNCTVREPKECQVK